MVKGSPEFGCGGMMMLGSAGLAGLEMFSLLVNHPEVSSWLVPAIIFCFGVGSFMHLKKL